MSLGYADRLSFREDLGGRLGDPELQDSDEEVARKVALLASWVRTTLGCINVTYIPAPILRLALPSCSPSSKLICMPCHRDIS